MSVTIAKKAAAVGAAGLITAIAAPVQASSTTQDNPYCTTDYYASFTKNGTSGPTPAVASTYDYNCSGSVSEVKVHWTNGTSTFDRDSQTAIVYKSSSKTPDRSEHRVCKSTNYSQCSGWVTLK